MKLPVRAALLSIASLFPMLEPAYSQNWGSSGFVQGQVVAEVHGGAQEVVWELHGFSSERSWTLNNAYRQPSVDNYLRARNLFARENHLLGSSYLPPEMPTGLPGTPFAGKPITVDVILETLLSQEDSADRISNRWRWLKSNWPRSGQAPLANGWSLFDFKTYVARTDPRWGTFDMAGNFIYGVTGSVLEVPPLDLLRAAGSIEQTLAAKRCFIDHRPNCNVSPYDGPFSDLYGEKPAGYAAIKMGIDYVESGQLIIDYFNDPDRLPAGPGRDAAMLRRDFRNSAERELQRRMNDPVLRGIEQRQQQREIKAREKQRQEKEELIRKQQERDRIAAQSGQTIIIDVALAPKDDGSYTMSIGPQ